MTENTLTRALAAHRAAGRPVLDLTCTNPTDVGLPYPADLLASLGNAEGVRYRPHPLGMADARQVIAEQYAARIDPDHVVLTASTSEAYAWIFKLLCNPGDDVLVPQPSYPLFELLTSLEGVSARPYLLEYHRRWTIDRPSLERAATPRTRLVLVVSPNNPTGSWLTAADRDWLIGYAGARGLAVVSDEVFSDYPLSRPPDAASLVGEERVLTFVLGGLSKSAGLPQVKLGWMLVSGPDSTRAEALDRLELVGDTYLSTSTPVQLAARRLLESGSVIRQAIRGRLRRNLDALKTATAAFPACDLLEPEGGWAAVLRVPAVAPEETIVLRLLEEAEVLAHPGYFFDFPHEAHLVISLLPEPALFDEAIGRLLRVAGGSA